MSRLAAESIGGCLFSGRAPTVAFMLLLAVPQISDGLLLLVLPPRPDEACDDAVRAVSIALVREARISSCSLARTPTQFMRALNGPG